MLPTNVKSEIDLVSDTTEWLFLWCDMTDRRLCTYTTIGFSLEASSCCHIKGMEMSWWLSCQSCPFAPTCDEWRDKRVKCSQTSSQYLVLGNRALALRSRIRLIPEFMSCLTNALEAQLSSWVTSAAVLVNILKYIKYKVISNTYYIQHESFQEFTI